MAASKGKMLKEQITFDFFDEVKVEKPKKEKVVKIKANKKENVKPVKQTIFRKNKLNIKSNHKQQNRKVRTI